MKPVLQSTIYENREQTLKSKQSKPLEIKKDCTKWVTGTRKSKREEIILCWNTITIIKYLINYNLKLEMKHYLWRSEVWCEEMERYWRRNSTGGLIDNRWCASQGWSYSRWVFTEWLTLPKIHFKNKLPLKNKHL